MSTTRISPKIPDGPYPQDLLWPHVGRAPMRMRTSKTISIVESGMTLPPLRKLNLRRGCFLWQCPLPSRRNEVGGYPQRVAHPFGRCFFFADFVACFAGVLARRALEADFLFGERLLRLFGLSISPVRAFVRFVAALAAPCLANSKFVFAASTIASRTPPSSFLLFFDMCGPPSATHHNLPERGSK